MNPKKPTPRYITITMVKFKTKRILKTASKKKSVTCKGTPISMSADFSTEILQARRYWHETFQVIKSKNLQPRLFHPARLSF